MRGLSGTLMIGIGILNTVFGFVIGRQRLTEIVSDGFLNAVGNDLGRNSIFWFMFAGFAWFILGYFCLWFERQFRRPVPALVGWELLLFAALGIALMPVSGFWLILGVAVYMLVVARHASSLTKESSVEGDTP